MMNKHDFQDIIESVKNLECDCLICRNDNYIHQNKHDDLCGQQKVDLASSI